MSDQYLYWRSALAGEKPKPFTDDAQPGFYRKKNGRGRDATFEPVAIWFEDGRKFARVGNRDLEGPPVDELWNWCCANPISEETWRAVSERNEPWPDAHDPKKNKAPEKPDTLHSQMLDVISGAVEPTIKSPLTGTDHNRAMAELTGSILQERAAEQIIRKITEARAGLSQYAKIETDTQSGQALSLKNTITSLAGDLDKHREALVRPHIDAQRAVNDRLNPVIKDAKAGGAALLRAIGAWEDHKREVARRAQAETDRKAAEHAAAVRKAEESNAPPPPPLEEAKPNTPPPVAQVAAAVGRKASVKVKQFVVSIDEDKAFAMFKGNAELSALLMALAQKAIDAGMPVPGAVTEERSVVR